MINLKINIKYYIFIICFIICNQGQSLIVNGDQDNLDNSIKTQFQEQILEGVLVDPNWVLVPYEYKDLKTVNHVLIDGSTQDLAVNDSYTFLKNNISLPDYMISDWGFALLYLDQPFKSFAPINRLRWVSSRITLGNKNFLDLIIVGHNVSPPYIRKIGTNSVKIFDPFQPQEMDYTIDSLSTRFESMMEAGDAGSTVCYRAAQEKPFQLLGLLKSQNDNSKTFLMETVLDEINYWIDKVIIDKTLDTSQSHSIKNYFPSIAPPSIPTSPSNNTASTSTINLEKKANVSISTRPLLKDSLIQTSMYDSPYLITRSNLISVYSETTPGTLVDSNTIFSLSEADLKFKEINNLFYQVGLQNEINASSTGSMLMINHLTTPVAPTIPIIPRTRNADNQNQFLIVPKKEIEPNGTKKLRNDINVFSQYEIKADSITQKTALGRTQNLEEPGSAVLLQKSLNQTLDEAQLMGIVTANMGHNDVLPLNIDSNSKIDKQILTNALTPYNKIESIKPYLSMLEKTDLSVKELINNHPQLTTFNKLLNDHGLINKLDSANLDQPVTVFAFTDNAFLNFKSNIQTIFQDPSKNKDFAESHFFETLIASKDRVVSEATNLIKDKLIVTGKNENDITLQQITGDILDATDTSGKGILTQNGIIYLLKKPLITTKILNQLRSELKNNILKTDAVFNKPQTSRISLVTLQNNDCREFVRLLQKSNLDKTPRANFILIALKDQALIDLANKLGYKSDFSDMPIESLQYLLRHLMILNQNLVLTFEKLGSRPIQAIFGNTQGSNYKYSAIANNIITFDSKAGTISLGEGSPYKLKEKEDLYALQNSNQASLYMLHSCDIIPQTLINKLKKDNYLNLKISDFMGLNELKTFKDFEYASLRNKLLKQINETNTQLHQIVQPNILQLMQNRVLNIAGQSSDSAVIVDTNDN